MARAARPAKAAGKRKRAPKGAAQAANKAPQRSSRKPAPSIRDPAQARTRARGLAKAQAAAVVAAGPAVPVPDAAAAWEEAIGQFLRRHIEVARADGYVVGVSGGLDSAVVAALLVRAVGPAKVKAVILPAADSDPEDEAHARLLCRHLGLKPVKRPIADVVAAFDRALGPDARKKGKGAVTVLGNAKSRTRMVMLYALGQAQGFLVCGTGNKSELLTGYFTKWGDGAADVMPIGDLFKTQVRELAAHLGLPEVFIRKPPSAGLHPGQTDESDMGVTYEELDAVLRLLELNHGVDVVVRKTGLPRAKVEKVERMVRGSEHKRRLAIAPKLGVRTVGIDWRRPVHWDG